MAAFAATPLRPRTIMDGQMAQYQPPQLWIVTLMSLPAILETPKAEYCLGKFTASSSTVQPLCSGMHLNSPTCIASIKYRGGDSHPEKSPAAALSYSAKVKRKEMVSEYVRLTNRPHFKNNKLILSPCSLTWIIGGGKDSTK